MSAGEFSKLLEPFQIKQVKFRNRLIKTPNDLGFADLDGAVPQQILDYYESIAKGGIGAIIGEHSYVDSNTSYRPRMISIADDKVISSLAQLTEVVHKHGCPIIQQLNHLGPQFISRPAGIPAMAPSLLNEDYMLSTFGRIYNLKPLKISEIETIVEKFAKAAERVKKAGYDGVEIHADHVYLLASFLSKVWNKRDDDYGCQTVENRSRFAVAVLRAIRQTLGQGFLIGIKITSFEYGVKECTTSEESQKIARILENNGADYISTQVDGYGKYNRISLPEQVFYPELPDRLGGVNTKILSSGVCVPSAAAIKKVVSVPVFTVGRIRPAIAERIVKKGLVDAVAMGRSLIADPEIPNKIAQGRLGDIVPCISCGVCTDLTARNEPVVCSVNPTLGKGSDFNIKPIEKKKRVVVVGGGPAGVEAARIAAIRGHDVTLFEKESKLGGSLILASLIKGVEIFGILDLIDYFNRQVTKLGIKIRLGEEFTTAINEEIKPDIVIIANGGKYNTLEIPGSDKKIVFTSEKLSKSAKFPLRLFGPKITGRLTRYWLPIGKRVVIIGGLIHGCEIAEFLVKRGRKVTIVEETDQLGLGIPEIPYKRALLKWLGQKGTVFFSQVKFKEITDKGLVIVTKDGSEQTIEADAVLVGLPPKSNLRLFKMLQEKMSEVYLIGDGKQPGLIIDAIADGFKIGNAI